MRTDRLANSCLRVDGQPLSSVTGDAGSESGEGDGMVFEHVYPSRGAKGSVRESWCFSSPRGQSDEEEISFFRSPASREAAPNNRHR